MAEKHYQMEEDCVEYYLFPNLSAVDSEKTPTDVLNDCIDGFLANLSSYLVGYIWQNESFSLRPIDAPNDNLPPHIYGCTKFGDNIDDEWFIVFLLFELSKMYSDLIIRVIDNDGEFLLIEMAENLPKWLTPETSENRVFIHQGSVHIIPKQQKTGPLSNFPSDTPTVSTSISLITDFTTLTKCSSAVQSAIMKRISSYPNKIKEDQHVAHCYLPASLAVILKKQPSLLSAAVQAFYTRDAIDLKACRMMKFFPPEMRVMTAITFTKCLYAQLIQQKYVPDKLIGWGIPPHNNPHFKAFDLGMKLGCGFEILVSNCKQKKNSNLTPTPSELYSDIRWQRYIKSLQNKGYFRGELEGSKLYSELLEKAQQYYCSYMLNSTSSSPSVGQQILSLLDSIDIDLEQLREEAKNLQPPDDDSWLELTPETLDGLLQEKFSSLERNALHDEASTAIVEGLKKFINHPSGIDGVEFPSRNDDQTNKNNKSKRITMDPDAFADAYQSILDFKLPDWEEGSSTDMSDYSDDDELQESDLSKPGKGNRKSATQKMLNKMEEYMEQMDRELASTKVGQSFDRLPNKQKENGSSEGDAKDDTLESYSPVDVDLSALRNILESYQSQQGLSGPASNMMSSMGIELPRNTDQ